MCCRNISPTTPEECSASSDAAQCRDHRGTGRRARRRVERLFASSSPGRRIATTIVQFFSTFDHLPAAISCAIVLPPLRWQRERAIGVPARNGRPATDTRRWRTFPYSGRNPTGQGCTVEIVRNRGGRPTPISVRVAAVRGYPLRRRNRSSSNIASGVSRTSSNAASSDRPDPKLANSWRIRYSSNRSRRTRTAR